MHKTSQKRATLDQQVDTRFISSIFQQQFHADIFFSRCQDTGEKPDLEKAKMFKESLNKVNSKKFPFMLNLNSMRLGVNAIMKLISILQAQTFTHLNLADNSISEYGMHAIKSLISNSKIQSLNLASNMISQVGLSLILEEFIKNTHIKTLNLGIQEGSIRKNSFGIDGARCLAAILLQNKVLQSLCLQDNDIGINGAEIISIPLKKNKQLRQLKISQNLIKTEGAEYILLNALNLSSLDLGKNFIKSSIGPTIKKYVETNKNLKKINLQLNQLLAEGVFTFFEGAVNSALQQVNLRGNAIGDRGLQAIESIFNFADRKMQKLHTLNLSGNDFTRDGVKHLITIINCCNLHILNLSKNILGDDGVIQLIQDLKQSSAGQIIEKLDFSGCKVSDKGFMHIMQNVNLLAQLKYLRMNDNYISQKFQKIYVDLLDKNNSLISLTLTGNRLSLSGIKGISKIIDRNLKNFEEREPKKMKSEIFNLKEKQKKIKEAQQKIQKQKREIAKLQQTKSRLTDNISRLQRQEKEKRYEFDEAVKKKTQFLQSLVESSDNKVQALTKIKQQKQKKVDELNTQLAKLREKRKQLEYQLTVTENEGEMIEKQFQKKKKIK